MVQVYSDKTATALKENAKFAYPVHGVFVSFTKEFCSYISDHGYTIACLLPVSLYQLRTFATKKKRAIIETAQILLLS